MKGLSRLPRQAICEIDLTADLNGSSLDNVSRYLPMSSVIEPSRERISVTGQMLDVPQRNSLAQQVRDGGDAKECGDSRDGRPASLIRRFTMRAMSPVDMLRMGYSTARQVTM